MPKTYLTTEDRRRAEAVRENRRQDDLFACELERAKKRKRYTYEDISKLSGLSIPTCRKYMQNPNTAGVSDLRSFCLILGIKMEISAVAQEGAIT